MGNDFEAFTFQIIIKKVKKFTAKEGENHKIKLSSNQNPVVKGFSFDRRTAEDSCPNLAKKKSFISFDEIVKKVKDKKTNTRTFIESHEKTTFKEYVEFKNKV